MGWGLFQSARLERHNLELRQIAEGTAHCLSPLGHYAVQMRTHERSAFTKIAQGVR